jgi:8-oxo-dGTP pyrophosphatase MutT (NUDIX family)
MEEFFTIVGPKDWNNPDSEIVACGCATRNIVHGPSRIPHASVQIIVVRCGTENVFIQQRSERVRNSPGMWDCFGGHVSFQMGILLSANGLVDASLETALQEAREEMLITVNGETHLIQKAHFRQIGKVGQFRWGVDDPQEKNVEYSTAFALCIPHNAIVSDSPFEMKDGTVELLKVREIPWSELLEIYKASKAVPQPTSFTASEFNKGFADGIVRVFDLMLSSDRTHKEVDRAVNWCKEQPY